MISSDGAAKNKATTRVHSIEGWVFRCPIERPVQTSFGIMHDRPALFVRAVDEFGGQGWGEIWCNFPGVGAEHRARLVQSVLAPLILGREFQGPEHAFTEMTNSTKVLALQSGEPGPIAQCIAGIDIALWDLAARGAGLPLWQYLGGSAGKVNTYASGLNPTSPDELAAERWKDGFRAFKLKVGFGDERDLGNLRALRNRLGNECSLMVDANQAWDIETTARMAERMHGFRLDWLEEPVVADTPWWVWQDIAANSPIPLAAGENLRELSSFDEAIRCRALAVIQPDIAKWGGVSGCLQVARNTISAGLRYCPHYLGGGIGLLASAHLLAAVGGDGFLEIDANPNPLREMMSRALGYPDCGVCTLDAAPGLGDMPDIHSQPFSRWLAFKFEAE